MLCEKKQKIFIFGEKVKKNHLQSAKKSVREKHWKLRKKIYSDRSEKETEKSPSNENKSISEVEAY